MSSLKLQENAWHINAVKIGYNDMKNTVKIREAIPHQLCSFFEHRSKGGGGSNPCSKILLQIFYYSKGLFGNMKDFLRAKMSHIEGKIV